MDKLQDYRAQEAACRKRALLDEKCREVWLARAEGWAYLARKEAAHHFKESTATSSGDLANPTTASANYTRERTIKIERPVRAQLGHRKVSVHWVSVVIRGICAARRSFFSREACYNQP
jgi:hypothetical protein